ncbi:hypothetical protein FA95DRAFT_1524028 [Auriscalpium vulgare]|uniref:Uncharacterized protein n=1 Tax=Auriscalpium vulgare TaxID=40419 RepID=A0ACB8RHJ1_9AGAM|nr:hypothetical protein FA95DRAFT_1524028 [Auriscalpium vulgare]
MSLLSHPDLLIHSLRLNYLRNVDDPYGARLISFSPSFSSDPYISLSGFADVDRWPELAAPSSPPLSQDEADDASRPRSISGFPGASGLKYSQTILGPSRTGAMGLGVNGRRRASVRNPSRLQQTSVAPSTPPQDGARGDDKSGAGIVAASPLEDASQEEARGAELLPFQFVPKFKGAAEMDERRRLRMQARRGAAQAVNGARAAGSPAKAQIREMESSSEEEDDSSPADDEDDFDDVPDGSMDMDGDEFDADFAGPSMGVTADSVSDGLSILSASISASVMSTSNSSNNPSSLPVLAAPRRARLSPVNEGRHPEDVAVPGTAASDITGFEMVTPPPPKSSDAAAPPRSARPRRTGSAPALNAKKAEEEGLFARVKVGPPRAQRSALSSMLAAGTSSNPFSDQYSAIAGRGVSAAAAMEVTVFVPSARRPAGKPMVLSVRKDATVEEVLGFALWTYWEEGWEPRLDEGGDVPEEKLSAVGWVLRIAEDDGEVDEDFPPPDRTGKIQKFNFDAYAVLEASATQIQQNKILESKIQRSPSRVAKTRKPDSSNTSLNVTNITPGLSASIALPSTLGTSLMPSSFNASSYGPQMFLRIRVQDTADAVHISTTIPVSATMYMQEALEMVCRKRKLPPKDYALLLGDMSILIPLDRTVASLQGKSDLMLVKRSMLPTLGVDVGRPAARSTDPNASIFKRMSETPEAHYNSAKDFTAAYKKYTVFRKMPMLVGRHERVLAIDGPYVHIMPSSNKAKVVFDNGKTSSYHINSVVSCQQSAKSSSSFRFVVHRVSRDGGNKRYEFEAESAKVANEIVQMIKGLKSTLERTGTVNKSRRSKHIG